MIKQTRTYQDANGATRTEDLYFNLNEIEMVRLVAKLGVEDLKEYVKVLSDNGNLKDMIAFLEEMILSSYGTKSDDGKSFVKDAAKTKAFEQSQAYSDMFVELLNEPAKAMAFGEGIVTKPTPKESLGDQAAAKFGVLKGTQE